MTIDNKELNNVEATKEQTGQTSDTWQAYTKKIKQVRGKNTGNARM